MERIERLIAKVDDLPLLPGVYLMKDRKGEIIYVGKAKALRNRVGQYFKQSHTGKVAAMVEKVQDFDTVVCSTEFEALILECSLIKLHNPKYNILLKDDKGYHYVKISKEPYPRITGEKQMLNDGAEYIGPYISGFVVNETADEACRVFQLPTCRKQFPKEFRKERPCLNYHIGRCMGVCKGNISQEAYGETINEARQFIRQGSKEVLASLQHRMEEAAEQLQFEKAARYRDRIRAIQRATEKQKVVLSNQRSADFVGGARDGDTMAFAVLKFREGLLRDKVTYVTPVTQMMQGEALSEFLERYYTVNADVPKEIWLYEDGQDVQTLADVLSKDGRKVTIQRAQRGEVLQTVLMAVENAGQQLSFNTNRTGREIVALSQLQQILGLPVPPKRIESFDISHTAGTDVVGGMVVFVDAKPQRSSYRRFSIKTFSGNDDTRALHEVATRRFRRYQEEKDTEKGFGILPDLILVDGGKGQVAAVKRAASQCGIQVPIFGLVKDSKHKTRGITDEGEELGISPTSRAFRLVTEIQDEVHRFAITYHHQKSMSRSMSLKIESAPGIGKTRAGNLLRSFKTLKAIRAASVEELAAVEGMTAKAAESLYHSLREDEE